MLKDNIKRIREGQRITYVELAERLESVGRTIPVLGLRRIERGERRVDVDDLLALAYALGVPPVDLLVSGDLDAEERYGITPDVQALAGPARSWISGSTYPRDWPGDSTDPFGIPTPEGWQREETAAIRWMPRDRASRVMEWSLAGVSKPATPNDPGDEPE
jgi:transcriptional regulator with XRE-family HTH domain